MSDEKIGKFQVLETLGTGAHSTILRIRRAVDAKEYALKVVPIDSEEDKKYLDQAKHEFEIGKKLNHPNLCKVHLFETESDWRFRVKKAKLLIEYVNGKTLDQTPLLKMARILRVFEKTAAGLVHSVICAKAQISGKSSGKDGASVDRMEFKSPIREIRWGLSGSVITSSQSVKTRMTGGNCMG